MSSALSRRILTGAAALHLLLISGCTEYQSVPHATAFEREANRISENLNKPVPPTPGIKTESVATAAGTTSARPFVVGQGPTQDLFQGLNNNPLNLDLRFEDAEVRDVATTILGDILKKPYVVDTTLQGR